MEYKKDCWKKKSLRGRGTTEDPVNYIPFTMAGAKQWKQWEI